MPTPQEIQQIQQLQAALKQTLDQLNKTNGITSQSVQDIVTAFGSAQDAVAALNNLLTQANDELNQSADTVDILNSKFKALLTTVALLASKQGEVTTEERNQLKAARDRVTLAKRLENDVKGLVNLSVDELQLTTRTLEKLKDKDQLDQKALEYAKKRLEEELKSQRALEAAGKVYGGIAKIPVFGSAFNPTAAKKVMELELESDRLAGRKANHIAAFGKGLKAGITSMMGLNGLLAITTSLFSFLKESIFMIDSGISSLAKTMNVSYDAAQMMYERFQGIQNSSNDWSRSSANLEKTHHLILLVDDQRQTLNFLV